MNEEKRGSGVVILNKDTYLYFYPKKTNENQSDWQREQQEFRHIPFDSIDTNHEPGYVLLMNNGEGKQYRSVKLKKELIDLIQYF